MPEKNDIVRTEITDITPEGAGVGKTDGYVLFVPRTAVGDIADVKILKALKSYGFAKVEKLISPSPDRCDYDCDIFGPCGGCLFRHIKYETELQIKKSWVDENFHRIGGLDISCDAVVPSPQVNGYRNKAQLPCGYDSDGKVSFGFYSSHSHRIVSGGNCMIQPDFYGKIIDAVSGWCDKFKIAPYDETEHKGILRHLYIRDGRASGEIMVCLVINSDALPRSAQLVEALKETKLNITSIVFNINKKPGNEILGDKCVNIYGKDYISDTLCGLHFDISPLSFYQINHDGAEKLYGIAREFADLKGGETLLDLYCGAGTIGLSMAGNIKKLIGVEIVPEAVKNAKDNAKKNGITNAEFICADAGEAAVMLSDKGIKPDVVIIDPPRKGCGDDVYSAMGRMKPEKIVMVSCNSATAARDAAEFAKIGYKPVKLRALDMFPRTGHVECVVEMERV